LNVWNSDQSAFQYEMASGRCYDFKGTKDVLATLVDKKSFTHTHTV